MVYKKAAESAFSLFPDTYLGELTTAGLALVDPETVVDPLVLVQGGLMLESLVALCTTHESVKAREPDCFSGRN